MINEYLFLSDEHRITVEVYKPDSVTVEISSIENTPLWVASYSLANKNEDSAKKLSEVHTIIMHYSPLVLSCESSEYYNRILFPLVNELERKLRKLLYLAAAISDNEKAQESIKQLEDKDFGDIFDLLFIDQNFILNMKKRINADAKSEFNGKSKYSKEEIKSYLDSLVEHTLWDTILSEKDVPTLRNRFRDVQTYRNDVMHAHNIGKELFGKARYLFDKINKELDCAIGKLIGASEVKDVEPDSTEQKPEVNTAITIALTGMDLSALTDAFKGVNLSPAVLEMSSHMSKVLEGIQLIGASAVMTEALKNLTPAMSSPAIIEAMKGMSTIANNPALVDAMRKAYDFQTSPAMENVLKQLVQLSEVMRSYQQTIDALRPYVALQESLRSITERLPHNLKIGDEPDDAEKGEFETDNNEDKPEEGNPNE